MVEAGKACAQETALPVDACRSQVERIVQSADFDATPRERRFLQYVVDETLAGRAARIKAYSIATEVFDRNDSFDPQNDPIVRIEAGRLRRALERYYLMAGNADTLVITIPKGGYVPVFSEREPVEAPNGPAVIADDGSDTNPAYRAAFIRRHGAMAAVLTALFVGIVVVALNQLQTYSTAKAQVLAPEPPRLLIQAFDSLGGQQVSADIATGLNREIIGQLSRFKDITVVTADVETTMPVRYELQGSVSTTPDIFRLRVRLMDRSDGAILWAESYEGSPGDSDLVKTQIEIADDVAATLAQVDGVIFHAEVRNQHNTSPDSRATYRCILSFHTFRTTLDSSRIPEVQECLEATVLRHPDYATAWALLALTEIDALRSQFPYDEAMTRQVAARALDHARRAVALNPHDVRGLQAEMLALYFDRQFEAGSRVGQRALALNPNDLDLMAEYGSRLALSGDWKTGCEMSRIALERRPVPSAYNNNLAILCAYFEGDLALAASLIGSVSSNDHPLRLLVAAIVYGEAGNEEGARKVRMLLQQSAPELLTNVRSEVEARLGDPGDIELIMQSLQNAGLTDTVVTGEL